MVDEQMTTIQNRSLEERVSHTERVVDGIRVDLTTVKEGQAEMRGLLTTLVNQANKPGQSWTAIVSAGVAAILLIGTIGWSNLQPAKENIDSLSTEVLSITKEVWMQKGAETVYRDWWDEHLTEHTNLDKRMDNSEMIAHRLQGFEAGSLQKPKSFNDERDRIEERMDKP